MEGLVRPEVRFSESDGIQDLDLGHWGPKCGAQSWEL